MKIFLSVAAEVSSCQQETLHGFRRPGEGVWSSTSEGHLVGAEKTWCGGVDCVTGAGDVCKCTEPCPCWWGVQWRVWSDGWCSPRISTQPTFITRVPLWVPWEDLYADDLVIIAESLEECVRRLLTWKEAMEKKGLRVNAGKTKIKICGTGLDLLQSSGEFPCAVCRTGVGSNSIFCNGCKHWVHKKCSGLKRLKKDPDYRCTQCQGTARPLDGRPQKEVQVEPDKLEVVASFCYLGDMLSAAGGCELSTTTCVKTAWKKFKDLLPVLSSRHLSFKKHVAMCTALVCGVQCSMPARLGHWQSRTSSFCSEMTGQWSDRSAMSGRKTLSPPGPMSYLCGLALRICLMLLKEEDFDGMDMWNTPMVQSRQPLTYRLMESMGLGGPKWHGSSWQRGIAESGFYSFTGANCNWLSKGSSSLQLLYWSGLSEIGLRTAFFMKRDSKEDVCVCVCVCVCGGGGVHAYTICGWPVHWTPFRQKLVTANFEAVEGANDRSKYTWFIISGDRIVFDSRRCGIIFPIKSVQTTTSSKGEMSYLQEGKKKELSREREKVCKTCKILACPF